MKKKARLKAKNRILFQKSMIIFLVGVGLLIISGILHLLANYVTGFAQWYATIVYPLWLHTVGRFFGLFPFSVSEFLLYILVLLIVMNLLWAIFRIVKPRNINKDAKVFADASNAIEEKNVLADILNSKEENSCLIEEESRFSAESKQKKEVDGQSLIVVGKRKIFRILKVRLNALGIFCLRIFVVFSVLVFLFMVNCGINYHRIPLAQASGLEIRYSSVAELAELTIWLRDELNARAPLVERNENGEMRLTTDLPYYSVLAMENLSEDFPQLGNFFPPPKELTFSWILSIQQVSGIFSPFTIEGNVNGDMPDFQKPFTATHEVVHVVGIMPEDEANFLAFLACIYSGNVEFEYSGFLLGWIYARNALARVDRDLVAEISADLSEYVRVDLAASRAFWNQFAGPVADLQTAVNDRYLRAQGQEAGIRSYGMMVDLLLAYVRD